MFQIFVLAVCLSVTAKAGYTSFFYSGFPGTIQSAPVPSGIHYQPAPVAYQSFVPQQHYVQPQIQSYSAFPTFPSFSAGHGFGYQQSFPEQFVYHTAVHDQHQMVSPTTSNVATTTPASVEATTTQRPTQAEETTPDYDEVEQDEESVITNAAFRASTQAPLDTRSQNLEVSNDNFRGFGYRNEFETGRSHFVFITGPEAYRFPQSAQQVGSSHSSASDAVDSIATSTRTTSTPTTTYPDHSLDALYQYLNNPQIGVQRFYSVNNALVMRSLQDEIPALPTHQFASINSAQKTLPFTEPISPLFPLLRSSFQLDVETVKPTEENAKLQEPKEEMKEDTKETDNEKEDDHEESASTIEAKSVKPEDESTQPITTMATPTTTEDAVVTEPSSTTISTTTEKLEASSTTTSTTTEKMEETTAEAVKEEKSTMAAIVVE